LFNKGKPDSHLDISSKWRAIGNMDRDMQKLK